MSTQVFWVVTDAKRGYVTGYVAGGPGAHTRVSIGKAAHRCHGWLPYLDACVLTTAPKPRSGELYRGADGKWTRG